MRDPVLLPSSKTIIDRSTIKQHYLSDATDPFNRVPLKWEDIVDATEMKEKIQAFLADRKAKRRPVAGTGEGAVETAAEAAAVSGGDGTSAKTEDSMPVD
jgi:ubiquitin conjugation factor E4 B